MSDNFSLQAWFQSQDDALRAFSAKYLDGALVSEVVGEDSSARRYFRASYKDSTALLMQSVPDDHSGSIPGHKVKDFIKISALLREYNIHAPEIYYADEARGFILLEDFGNITFNKALLKGENINMLYTLATDTLKAMPETQDINITLPDYYKSHVYIGRRRVVDWYMPAILKRKNPDGLVQSYLQAWEDVESLMPPCPQGFAHADYNFDNLMYLPNLQGISQCGVLDFQGAMIGPAMYDLANLLEDARVTVPKEIRDHMLNRYCVDMSKEGAKLYKDWYRIVATQFHCRVIGQFIRLALVNKKPQYMNFIPRVAVYLRESLENDILHPVKKWFDDHKLDFDPNTMLEPREIERYIRDDAF